MRDDMRGVSWFECYCIQLYKHTAMGLYNLLEKV